MRKEQSIFNKKGFGIIELVLASALFGLFITILAGSYMFGQESTVLSGQRSRAILLAEEGLEAARNIRDESFDNLVDGIYGLAISSGQWNFSGSSDITDIFTREVEISTVDQNRKSVQSRISWQQNAQRQGQVVLDTYLTNWSVLVGGICDNQASQVTFDVSNPQLSSGNRQLDNIFITNNNPSCNVVIDTITMGWTDNTKNLNRIRFDNSNIWSGSSSSGLTIDINNVTIANTDGMIETRYRFDGKMDGNVFAITLTFTDGTTITKTGITPI